jgi:pyruvate/2-oxoglutarate dehydrogenase complex dihydrolipoamide acyltransferase (E2) component
MNSTRTWTCGLRWAPVVVVILLLAACGGGTSTPPPAAEQPAPAATPQPAAPPTAAAQPAPPAEAPPAAAASPFVAEHETGAEVTLVEAKRTGGDSVTVKWRYRNATASDVKVAKGGTSWISPYELTAEAFLVDPVNKKKYLVITDAEKLPLASKHGDWQGVTLKPGQTLSAWAKFPAPPADVEQITVSLPGVPPFEDVPVVK